MKRRWQRPGIGDLVAAAALLPLILVLDRLAAASDDLKAAAGIVIAVGAVAFVLSLTPNQRMTRRSERRSRTRRTPR